MDNKVGFRGPFGHPIYELLSYIFYGNCEIVYLELTYLNWLSKSKHVLGQNGQEMKYPLDKLHWVKNDLSSAKG